MVIPQYVIKHLRENGNTVLPNKLVEKNSIQKVLKELNKIGFKCKIESNEYWDYDILKRKKESTTNYIVAINYWLL